MDHRALIFAFSKREKFKIIAYQIGLLIVNFCEILERQCSDCTACTLINDVIAGTGIRGVSHSFPYIRELQSNRVGDLQDDKAYRNSGQKMTFLPAFLRNLRKISHFIRDLLGFPKYLHLPAILTHPRKGLHFCVPRRKKNQHFLYISNNNGQIFTPSENCSFSTIVQ